MPSFLGTIGLICLRSIIGIIIILIFSVIITEIIFAFYKKINKSKIVVIQQDNYQDLVRHILYFVLFIVVIISFISPKGTEYAYRNRLGLLSVTEQDQLYHKPGSIHKFFNPNAKTVINTSQLNKIKNYHLVKRNHKYEKQRQLIIKKAKYRLHYKKDYYMSDNS